MRRKAAAARGWAVSRLASLSRFSSFSRLSRASRISSFSRFSRLSSCAMMQGLMPRIFVLLAIFVAKMASADVVIDRSSEIVMAPDAPYATRLAAEELNFFLKGVLGKPLPVVSERTAGRTAIEKVMDHAAFAPGWHIAPDNREGVRINFDLDGAFSNGWFLLRLSVHDPVLPLNLESDVAGGVKQMAQALLSTLDGAEGIELGKLREFIEKA